MYSTENDSIQLRWDHIEDTDPSEIENYKIYYCTHNTNNWKQIEKNVEVNDSLFVNIYRNEIDSNDSVFSFAVQIFLKNGHTSKVYTSIDSLTAPHGGWFVKWKN